MYQRGFMMYEYIHNIHSVNLQRISGTTKKFSAFVFKSFGINAPRVDLMKSHVGDHSFCIVFVL
jgi:hypothetical protein